MSERTPGPAPRGLRGQRREVAPTGARPVRRTSRGAAQAPPEVVSRRLRSRAWRAANSWWLALPAVGLPWLAFLYMGLRARRPQWVAASAGYFVGAGGALSLLLTDPLLLNLLGALGLLGLWGLGLVHSVMANSRWLRIKAAFTDQPVLQGPPEPAAPLAPSDPVAVVGEQLRALVRRVNAAGGRLPDGAVPKVREIEDVLRPVVAHVAKRGVEAEELHHLETIVGEYLPAAVDRYLDLPDDYARTHRGATGATPAQELLTQLGLLHEGALQLRSAVYDHDAQQLAVQGRFLDAKFRRSDLDL
ncbi:hypothetical protein [Kineococcus sp. SYSU DK004]|uniref:hypothetical protein n=1 Tax=Kineococcus sp. SYSU DK004 TaxID=3383125 RepID=UPI003D7E4927